MNKAQRVFIFVILQTLFLFHCENQTTETYAPTSPEVTTAKVSRITTTSAQCGGWVHCDGGEPVTSRGICWGESRTPTLNDNITVDGSGLGDFESSLTGLKANTKYYVRAYATNIAGTGYGIIRSFIREVGTVRDVDGNIYQTVKIGNKWWMAENLKTRHYADGTPLENGTGKGSDNDDFSKKYYFVYMNNESTVESLGLYYTWAAATNDAPEKDIYDLQGICPNGWRLPLMGEWSSLETYIGGEDSSGIRLREWGYSHWKYYADFCEGLDEFGFKAIGAGIADYNGFGYYDRTEKACFWSLASKEEFGNYYGMEYNHQDAYSGWYKKNHGLSVRCVKE